MATEQEFNAAWAKFSNDMQTVVADGNTHSAFLFVRIDQQADGGLSTHQLAFNTTYIKYIGMAAFVLKELEKNAPPNYKYMASRAFKMFNKLFGTFNKERVIN